MDVEIKKNDGKVELKKISVGSCFRTTVNTLDLKSKTIFCIKTDETTDADEVISVNLEDGTVYEWDDVELVEPVEAKLIITEKRSKP